MQDFVVHCVDVLVVVGGEAGEHLVEEDAEGPPVDHFAVALAVEEFGGEVFGGAAEGLRSSVSRGMCGMKGRGMMDERAYCSCDPRP